MRTRSALELRSSGIGGNVGQSTIIVCGEQSASPQDFRMTKRSLAAQLRNHAVQKGDFSVTELDDDAVLTKYTCCSACGAGHVTGEALDRLIESSLDEEDFRTRWNDLNGSLCKTEP